ncbi:pilus assembly protein [Methylomonas sp. LL1]|uniref:pilus assembly PilX family protein n=1 Tax=Methylomonas sp. LL1 TaxID=2785785 RepID=UPI0018C3825D|nr:PilX N-terminal domain-containing pilus assembly protein [Methylomonas sp. LL1]QPK64185.1 pilus assembly protein [Methylomonas sp. LL1]
MKALTPSPIAQQGVALFVSLMMLILVTLIGVAGVRMVSLEEKMAGNSYDRNLAFQAAEAALREAEKYAEDNKPTPAYTDADATCPTSPSSIDNCTSGVCPTPDHDCVSRWEDSTFTGWTDISSSLETLLGTMAGDAPQYFIEYLGNTFNCSDGGASDPKNCKRYRVTARSHPATGRATVVLQSVYATN